MITYLDSSTWLALILRLARKRSGVEYGFDACRSAPLTTMIQQLSVLDLSVCLCKTSVASKYVWSGAESIVSE